MASNRPHLDFLTACGLALSFVAVVALVAVAAFAGNVDEPDWEEIPQQQSIEAQKGYPPWETNDAPAVVIVQEGGGGNYEWLIVGVIVPIGLALWQAHRTRKRHQRERREKARRQRDDLMNDLRSEDVHDALNRDGYDRDD
jgi:hypothetical protein